MPNHYELLALVDGRIADTELEGFRASLEETLKKHVSPIHYMHNLGRRKLAYPIKHQGYGTYLLCEFDAEGETIKKLERALSLTTELLRHCIERRKIVGAPIELERREEERRIRAPRRSQDEALLGKTPLNEGVSTPLLARTESTPPPSVRDVPVVEEQPSPDEESPKKKDGKVSYEELDKKLNELLSDDIL